jgi:hypothetical protein
MIPERAFFFCFPCFFRAPCGGYHNSFASAVLHIKKPGNQVKVPNQRGTFSSEGYQWPGATKFPHRMREFSLGFAFWRAEDFQERKYNENSPKTLADFAQPSFFF